MIEINWNIFKAKFNGKEQGSFEWLCYLLFCIEFQKPCGISRYRNQAGIETNPIEINGKNIGWQAKFFYTRLSEHKNDFINSINTTKTKYPEVNKIIFYTNQDFGQGKKKKDPKYKIEIEELANSKNVEIDWRTASFFESPFVCEENSNIIKQFFSLKKSVIDFDENKYLDKILNINTSNTISLFIKPIDKIKNISINSKDENLNEDKKINLIRRTDNLLNNLELKTINFLIGIGGSGKTTSCIRIIKKIAYLRKYDKESPLPVHLECSDFKENISDLIQDGLNIKSGTWKALPNSFIFIMDGLNEISYDKQKSLIKESEKLLDDYPIGILITTRDGKILNNIIINNFKAGYEIIPLSNIGIRKISKGLLPERDIENFISEYISKFNTNRLFRTPFLVSKAVEVFKTSQSLPNEIWKLLEIYFQKRIERNNELATEKFIPLCDYEIITELLSELAFNLKIKKKRKHFTKNELNQAITEAKVNRSLFILNDYKIYDIVTLLLNYEIITTDNSKYEFEHDIVADYFAAKKLAKCWRNYTNSINYENFEDIWLFTAEDIIENDYKEFIEIIATKDLILASECVRNMKKSADKYINKFIMDSYHKNTQFADYQSTIAMVFIGKDKYQNFLRNEFNKKNISESKKHFVKIALLKLGNEDIINEILNEAEKMDFLPLQTSGGAKELWKNVPYNLQIMLARKRIKKSLDLLKTDNNISLHQQNISFSIQTIIYNGGSIKDIKLMKRVLEEIKEYILLYYAYFCILFHDFENSKDYLLKKKKIFGLIGEIEITKSALDEGCDLTENGDDLQLINILEKSIMKEKQLQEQGKNIKIKTNKELTSPKKSLDDLLSDFDIHKVNNLIGSTFDLINNIDFCEEAKKNLIKILSENQLVQSKSYFWEIAAKYDIEEVNKLAFVMLKTNDLSRIARSADYVLLANWGKNKSEDFTTEIIKIVKSNKDKYLEFDYFRLLNFLAVKQKSESISEFINSKLKQFFKENLSKEELISELDVVVRYLIIASKIPECIKKEIIYFSIKFKELEIYSEMSNVYSSFLMHLSKQEINQILSEDISCNLKFLKALSRIQRTPIITDYFVKMINKAGRIDLYKELIQIYWCDEVADNIVSLLLNEVELNSHFSSFYESLFNCFSKDQAKAYIEPMLQKKISDDKLRILQFWYDWTINKKDSI